MLQKILLNKNVLLAEDNPVSQMVVKHTLLALGGNTDIAGDGKDALNRLGKNRYDLIMMDLQMPVMNGYETTLYIRNELKNEIPIIGMTAYAVKDEDKKCFGCGMGAYISKPFSVENLCLAIQKVLEPSVETPVNPYLLWQKEVSIDISRLYSIAENDKPFMQAMVATFLKNMPGTIEKIEHNLEAKDWENLYQTAHFAKSSLSIIKVNEMFDDVSKIENYSNDRTNLDAIPGLIETVKEKFLLAKSLLTEKLMTGYY